MDTDSNTNESPFRFAEWLVDQLRLRKMSMRRLSLLSGLSRSYLLALAGKSPSKSSDRLPHPSVETVLTIAKALDVSPLLGLHRAGHAITSLDTHNLEFLPVWYSEWFVATYADIPLPHRQEFLERCLAYGNQISAELRARPHPPPGSPPPAPDRSD